MALFCSPCKPPIVCPNFARTYDAIQRLLKSKTSNLETTYFEIQKVSIYTRTKTLNNKAQHRSNLSFSVELEEEPPSSVVIFVKGLAESTGEGGLKAAFTRFGEVSQVKLVLDKKTKQSLGSAFVWFVREEHARLAIEEMNGQFFEGRFIRVTLVKPGSCKTLTEPSSYRF